MADIDSGGDKNFTFVNYENELLVDFGNADRGECAGAEQHQHPATHPRADHGGIARAGCARPACGRADG